MVYRTKIPKWDPEAFVLGSQRVIVEKSDIFLDFELHIHALRVRI